MEYEAAPELGALTTEQAALRRVATLVARESRPVEIFVAVTEEAARVLRCEAVGLLRFEADETATLVAQSETPWDPPPLGTRFTLDGDNLVTQVFRTDEAARDDDWAVASGAVAQMASALGVRSAVASPVIVGGRLWGAIIAATSSSEPLAGDMESRLAQFTELVATAIANAEARDALGHLVEEQAALRRVATLVAQQPSTDEIFELVSVEVANVFGFDPNPASPDIAGVVRFEPGPVLVPVGASKSGEAVELGKRFPADELYVSSRVLRTGRSARIGAEDLDSVGGQTADWFRHYGLLTQVGSPIVVGGRLWGAMTVNSGDDLPADTEQRLERFTDLIATAIANAETGDARSRLADEQAALRRVATLVATGARPEDVFAAVAEEVGRVLPVASTTMARFEPGPALTTLAAWTGAGTLAPVGKKWPLTSINVGWKVLHTGEAARTDDYSAATDPLSVSLREAGVKSVVGSPIVVEGRLWGVVTVRSTEGPLPPGTEERLSSFTELVATAIANAEARDALALLAEEQAALRRVATLVADGIGPEGVFPAVAVEVDTLFGADVSAIVRFEEDGQATVLGDVGGPHMSGKRVTLDAGYVVDRVRKTRQSARFDTDDPTAADMPSIVRAVGIRSAVASPIVVEGEVWGAVTAASVEEPLSAGAEQHLSEFTELLATAVSNTQAHAAVREAAEEQGALRRVATLVAASAPPAEVFAVVTREIARVLGATACLLCRADEDGAVVVGSWQDTAPIARPGLRLRRGGMNLTTIVLDTGRPGRLDSYDGASGDAADVAQAQGVRSAVGAPILVEGRLWGLVIAGTSGDEPLPPGAEDRLAAFTELVATAIANTESSQALERVAAEQAALRRVATLVAAEASQGEIFSAVAVGVAGVLGEELRLVRYEGDVAVVVAASEGPHHEVLPLGTRLPVGGDNALTRVFRTGEVTRIDDYSKATGPIAETVQPQGLRSIVATPVVVEGRTWGAMIVGTFEDEPVPPGTEDRLAQFAELMATGIANTESRGELSRLLEEQAALRRVATLVADQADPSVIFASVAREVAHAVAGQRCAIGRFEEHAALAVIAYWSEEEQQVPVGASFDVEDDEVVAAIRESGRLLRIDDHEAFSGPLMDYARTLGSLPSTTIAAPVFVGGRIWGIIFTSTMAFALPEGTESRITSFAELVSTAIANASARQELVASRARIVTAGDEARRRIERNLHDGTQQRLIALGLDLQRVRADIPEDPQGASSALTRVEDDLEAILVDLRELSHGLHPPLLARLGLGPSLQALARRSPIPVRVDVDLPERPAQALETAAYYVVSEALTNAIKHSQASEVTVTIGIRDGLWVSVVDDGVGGADPSGGSGLTGLRDRVDALGGRFACDSPQGGGTRISVDLPIAL